MNKKPQANQTRSGVRNRDYLINQIGISKCPACQSTRRTRYFERETYALAAGDSRGSHIVWRACQCLECGVYRKDETTERLR